MTRQMLLAVVILTATAAVSAQDIDVESYWQARRAGAVGVVTGRLYAEAAVPSGAPRPITGATVTLLPRSATLMATFERLKQRARESSTAFTDAAPGMLRAKEAYESELVKAGAPDLARLVLVDRDGGFTFGDVPAGPWLLLAWYGTPVDVSSPKMRSRERGLYLPRTRVQGFQSVTLWLREVNVAAGATVTEEFTDRNGWFRGVVEERVPDVGH